MSLPKYFKEVIPLEMIRQLRLISQNYVVATAVSITLQLHEEMEVNDTRYPKVPSLHIEVEFDN
jgi:hypothetical protein